MIFPLKCDMISAVRLALTGRRLAELASQPLGKRRFLSSEGIQNDEFEFKMMN